MKLKSHIVALDAMSAEKAWELISHAIAKGNEQNARLISVEWPIVKNETDDRLRNKGRFYYLCDGEFPAKDVGWFDND